MLRPNLCAPVDAGAWLFELVGCYYEIKKSLFQEMNRTFSSLFGERLRSERKALGLKQDEAANLVGVTREHWGRCERGVAVLGGEGLAAFASAGADANYILTGQPSGMPKSPALSAEETTLLEYFRAATPAVRRAAMGALLGATVEGGQVTRQVMQNLSGGSHTMIGSVGGSVYTDPSASSKSPARKSKPRGA